MKTNRYSGVGGLSRPGIMPTKAIEKPGIPGDLSRPTAAPIDAAQKPGVPGGLSRPAVMPSNNDRRQQRAAMRAAKQQARRQARGARQRRSGYAAGGSVEKSTSKPRGCGCARKGTRKAKMY